MTYTLDERAGATTLTIDMDDACPATNGDVPPNADGDAILAALKATAEAL